MTLEDKTEKPYCKIQPPKAWKNLFCDNCNKYGRVKRDEGTEGNCKLYIQWIKEREAYLKCVREAKDRSQQPRRASDIRLEDSFE